jgi:hypothetical protein
MYEVFLPRENQGTWFPTKTSAYRFIRQSDQPWLLSRVDKTYPQATVVAVCGLLTDWEEILPEYANAVTGHHQDETVMIFDNAGDVITFKVDLASRTFVKDLFYTMLEIEGVVRWNEQVPEFMNSESVRKSMYNILNTLDKGTWIFRYPRLASEFDNFRKIFEGYATITQYDEDCWQVSVH